MTEQEAIRRVKKLFKLYFEDEPYSEHYLYAKAVNMSEKALEKQIPKEIKREINDGRFERHCPNGCQVTEVTMYADIKYCPYCGQAIKK